MISINMQACHIINLPPHHILIFHPTPSFTVYTAWLRNLWDQGNQRLVVDSFQMYSKMPN
jgi:hypothetical protein